MENISTKHCNRTRVLFILLGFQLMCNFLFVGHYLGHVNINNLFSISPSKYSVRCVAESKNVYTAMATKFLKSQTTNVKDVKPQVNDMKERETKTAGVDVAVTEDVVRNEIKFTNVVRDEIKLTNAVRDEIKFTHGSLPVDIPIPMIVHQILWTDTMTFRNYLSVLSVWKILKPYQIMLYTPNSFNTQEFVYNDWYQKATSRIASLQVVKLDLLDRICYSIADELVGAMSVLDKTGGVYVNINTIINSDLRSQLNNTFHAGIANDLSISFLGLAHNSKLPDNFSTDRAAGSGSKCTSAKLFTESEICCTITQDIFPYNIMRDNSSFGHLARTLFYGTPNIPVASTSFPPIPKIVHYVWFGGGDLDYSMYLSFISTQRFIKPLQIRIYVDTNNTSMYLKKMAEFSNVQIVFYGHLNTIFQTPVRAVSHASDFLRADVLYRFGGMYIDWDVYWLKPIDDLVSQGYETISSLDYYDDMFPRKTYPDTINMGVLLSIPGSRFISLWRDSYKHYSGRHHTWHAVENVYKLYEEHPDLLVIDKRLQIMCHEFRCHPLWLDDYKVVKCHHEFDFTKDVYAVHFTAPTPEAFKSEKLVKESKGYFADMARHILGES